MKSEYWKIIGSILLLSIICSLNFSCTSQDQAINSAIVQVWNSSEDDNSQASPLAFGVVVGDGTQVLTFLNYEQNTNYGTFRIVQPGRKEFLAHKQAVDPRTGTTLLTLEDGKLQAAQIGDATTIKAGQEVYLHGWTSVSYVSESTKTTARITLPQFNTPLLFSAAYGEAEASLTRVEGMGSIVADEKGNVLGLETFFSNKLALRTGQPGMMPPIININHALDFLMESAANQEWADGPVLTSFGYKNHLIGNFAGVLPEPADYAGMTSALKTIKHNLGSQIESGDLQFSDPMWYRDFDGKILLAAYPEPVQLKNSSGDVLAEAKWIGVQWDRAANQPDRLVFGIECYQINGSFEIKSDLDSLIQAIGSIP